MFHVRCSLAAREIKKFCRRALQDFFGVNVTLGETVAALKWIAGLGKPIFETTLKETRMTTKWTKDRAKQRRCTLVEWS